MRSTLRAAALALPLALVCAAPAAAAPELEPVGSFTAPTYVTSPPGDPRLFVTERAGQVRILGKDGVVNPRPSSTSRATPRRSASAACSRWRSARLRRQRPRVRLRHRRRRDAADPGVPPLAERSQPSRAGGRPIRAQPGARGTPTTTAARSSSTRPGGCTRASGTAAGQGPGPERPEPRDAARQAHPHRPAADRGRRRLQRPAGQPVRRLDPRARRDLGLWAAQPVPVLVRPPDRGPVARRRRGEHARGGRSRGAGVGGQNYGWRCYEGTIPTPMVATPCDGDRPCPAAVRPRPAADGACSITGGYVVRDSGLPTLFGRYLYGDLCVPEIQSATANGEPGTGDRNVGEPPRVLRAGRLRPALHGVAQRPGLADP